MGFDAESRKRRSRSGNRWRRGGRISASSIMRERNDREDRKALDNDTTNAFEQVHVILQGRATNK